jgi:hypothetical protein
MRLLITATLTTLLLAPLCAQDRPGLFFREDFKETEAAIPITQAHIANPDLVLGLHGPGKGVIKKSHHDQPADDPYYVWSGLAEGNWAVSLQHRTMDVDLTGQSKIRWRSKQAGFRELRIILQLASGEWIVGDAVDPASEDWRVREFNLSDIRWRNLDIDTVIEGAWVDSPDLGHVRAIGWTDLMRGGASAACSRLDWIEVDGEPVKRSE